MAVLFDQASSRDRMIASLETKESVNNIAISSTSVPIISILAEEIAQLALAEAYYKRETKWEKAQNLASLIYQGRFRGYEALRKQGAVGEVRVSSSATFNATYAQDIIIPKYTKFVSTAGTSFACTTTTTLPSTSNYVAVPIIQGIPKTYTYNASGTDLEKIQIYNGSIEEYYYDVYVNGTLWTRVDNIEESAATDKVYELHNFGSFEGIEIIFGNNIYGRKLVSGDVVLVKYVETLGANGNVEGLGVITSVSSTIYDVIGTAVAVYCTNLAAITGGKDLDSIEYIRKKGLQSFMGGDKAVTLDGYEYQITQSQYVEKAVVWGAYEYNIDNGDDPWDFIPSQDNVIRVSAYTSSGDQLSETEKTEIIEGLVDRRIKPPADIVQFVDVDFIGLVFHVDAYVLDRSVVLSDLQILIRDSLTDEYGLDNQEFKQPIYDTQWKAYVSDIAGVYYHNSSLELAAYASFSSAYVATVALLNTAITVDSIYVYAKNDTIVDSEYVLVAISSSSTWAPQSGYTATGTITHTTGQGTITLANTSPTSGIFTDAYTKYSLKFVYTPVSLNFVPTTRNQIFKIDSVEDVTVQYTV